MKGMHANTKQESGRELKGMGKRTGQAGQLRMIHCSGVTERSPDEKTERRAAWFIGFVSPSARLCELQTKPMSNITLSRKPSLAAAMSSIVRFSYVR